MQLMAEIYLISQFAIGAVIEAVPWSLFSCFISLPFHEAE